MASYAGSVSQGDAEVSFSQSGITDKNHISIFFEELQPKEILNL